MYQSMMQDMEGLKLMLEYQNIYKYGLKHNYLWKAEAVLTSTHNLCFEQKYEKYQNFYLKISSFLEVKFSTYLNRRVFVMVSSRVN